MLKLFVPRFRSLFHIYGRCFRCQCFELVKKFSTPGKSSRQFVVSSVSHYSCQWCSTMFVKKTLLPYLHQPRRWARGRFGSWIHAVCAKSLPSFHSPRLILTFISPGYILFSLQIWWVCADCSLIFLFLADRSVTWWGFFCCNISASSFSMLLIHRCVPHSHNCTEWLSESL